MDFTIKCPTCGKVLRCWYSKENAGRVTLCPACGGTVKLVPPPAPAPAPAAPPLQVAPAVPIAASAERAPVENMPPASTVIPQPLPGAANVIVGGNLSAGQDVFSPHDVPVVPQIAALQNAPAVSGPADQPQVVRQHQQVSDQSQQSQPPAYAPHEDQPIHEDGGQTNLSASDALHQMVSQRAQPAADGDFVVIDDENLTAVSEETLLTHQAAAEVGEAHVDVTDSELGQWHEPPKVVPVAPPVWAPPPLSGRAEVPAGARVERRFPPATMPADEEAPADGSEGEAPFSLGKRAIFWWAGGAIALVAVILIMVSVLSRVQFAPPWDQTHRSDILSMKEDAEDLSLAGKYREAYEKYQELERLVSGQKIEDPDLQDQLQRSWKRRDDLYDLLVKGGHPPVIGNAPAGAGAAGNNAPGAATGGAAPGNASSGAPAGKSDNPGSPVSVDHNPKPAVVPVAPVNPTAVGTGGNPPLNTAANPSVVTPATVPDVAVIPALTRPPVRPVVMQPDGVTDAQIGAAIQKGAGFLLSQFNGAEIPDRDVYLNYHDGLDCLAVYALMQSGLAVNDDRLDDHSQFMKAAIEAMKRLPMQGSYQTYARSLRSTALALYNRDEDSKTLTGDVDWLLRAQAGGGFTYTDQFPHESSNFHFWDNSNSQYGLLGVWSGAEVGVPVPSQFWREVQKHWFDCQLMDGEWPYRDAEQSGRRSMTLAGIASLFVTQDYLDGDDFGDKVGRPPFSPALKRGLDWLEQGNNSVIDRDSEGEWSYTLYGLERVGLASGFKYFGTHDWYREMANDIVNHQDRDGSWGANDAFHTIVDTSYALLFLARGRHPIIMNKLRFDGDWSNRPRDVANLARYASRELERPLNWQVVPLDHDWHDWTDSPILYMSSDKPPVLAPADVAKLKAYIENGGMLLTQADGDSREFDDFITDLAKQMFPQYPWMELPSDSPLLNISYRMTTHPQARIISNGSRILMMELPRDISKLWNLRAEKTGATAFEFGVNLALYASGRTEMRNRLDTKYLPAPPTAPAASMKLCQLKYDGNWNPEPAALPKAAAAFHDKTSLGIDLDSINIADLPAVNPAIAYLTGTEKIHLTDAQVRAIAAYVQNGGVLVIDPCGVPGEFWRTAREDLLARAFPNNPPLPMPQTHPMVNAVGDGMMDLSTPRIRDFARSYPGIEHTLPQILHVGKGHVVVMSLDLQSGLLGAADWGIAGYSSDYAGNFFKNLMLWDWDGQRD